MLLLSIALDCESFQFTCFAAARLKQVTKVPLTSQRERERMMADVPNLEKIFT